MASQYEIFVFNRRNYGGSLLIFARLSVQRRNLVTLVMRGSNDGKKWTVEDTVEQQEYARQHATEWMHQYVQPVWDTFHNAIQDDAILDVILSTIAHFADILLMLLGR